MNIKEIEARCKVPRSDADLTIMATCDVPDLIARIKELEEQELGGVEATLSQFISPEDQIKYGLDEHGHTRNVQHIFMRLCVAVDDLQSRLKECEEERDGYREALESISSGTEDKRPPYRCAPRDVLKKIASQALNKTPSCEHKLLYKQDDNALFYARCVKCKQDVFIDNKYQEDSYGRKFEKRKDK
jgi:hypothetical protein